MAEERVRPKDEGECGTETVWNKDEGTEVKSNGDRKEGGEEKKRRGGEENYKLRRVGETGVQMGRDENIGGRSHEGLHLNGGG